LPAADEGSYEQDSTSLAKQTNQEVKGSWAAPPKPVHGDHQPRSGAATGGSQSGSAPVPQPTDDRDRSNPEALRSGATLAHIKGDEDRYLLLRGYRRVALEGYFATEDATVGRDSGIERRTLAEMYRSQGMTLRALEAYAALIQEEPGNTAYQSIYAELRSKLRTEFIQDDKDTESQINKTNAPAMQDQPQEVTAQVSPKEHVLQIADKKRQDQINKLRTLLGMGNDTSSGN
jgi:hypothetical protein